MSDDTQSAAASTGPIEQRFIEALKSIPLPVAELLDHINALHASGQNEQFQSFVLVLEDTLAKAGELEGVVKLFEMRLEWQTSEKDAPDLTSSLREALNIAARKKRLHIALVDSISLGKGGVSLSESLRRLRLLLQCQPGVSCLDKTWGFGTIVRLDEFYRRLVVDFERKKGHALAFNYAAESLKLLGKDHILSVFHESKDAFFERVRKDPADIAILALKSFGPMSVTRMEDEFAAYGLLPAPEGYASAPKGKKPTAADSWKTFWNAARAKLKGNPNVYLPPTTKKNEPIALLVKAVAFGDETWFEELSRCTDAAAILARVAELNAKGFAGKLSEQQAGILADRLQYAYKAARTRTLVTSPAMQTAGDTAVSNESRYKHWQEGVRQGCADMGKAALLARAMRLSAVPVADWAEDMARPEFLYEACIKMSTRDLADLTSDAEGGFLRVKEDKEKADRFVAQLPAMPYALVEALYPSLLRGVSAQAARACIVKTFGDGDVPFPMLLWMDRHQDEDDIKTIVPPASIAASSLIALDKQTAGEDLRLFHQVAKCFEDFQWVTDLMDRMDDDGRQALLDRIRANDSAWEPPFKRKLVKDILAKYPDLATPHVEAAPVEAPRLTSWRSYNQYVENLRRLVEEEIPKNAHDIDVARSYGDLRENFEYQTAKDTQRMLLQRQADLNEQIAAVQGTDFADVPADVAAMGTEVVLRFEDGATKTYAILGEWDTDESLGILPCRSRIAEAVLGKAAGAQVVLPAVTAGDAPRAATIESVRTLSDAVRAWIQGR